MDEGSGEGHGYRDLTDGSSTAFPPFLFEAQSMADKINKPRIFEGYIANWRNYPRDEVKVRVARPSVLAPSQELLSEFNRLKKMYGRERAWELSGYEERFRREILSSLKATAKMREIKELAKTRRVRLICYEKSPPCHRFILKKLIKEIE